MIEKVTAQQIRDLQAEIREPFELSDGCPDDWHACDFDPSIVMGALDHIRLEDGVTLVGYHQCKSMGQYTVVFAVPVGTALPDPASLPADERGRPKLETPYETVMHAVVGDSTPMSYLEASIFSREVGELGFTWHSLHWKARYVLDAEPVTGQGKPKIPLLRWQQEKPSEWAPFAEAPDADGRARVQFHTYCPVAMIGVEQHIDTYGPGTYVCETETRRLASPSEGIMF